MNIIHIGIKRALSLALSAAVAVSCTVTAFAQNGKIVTVESPVPEKVLVIGDSIATGYGLEGYDGGRDNVASYVNILKAEFESELKAGTERFENKAKDGQTSSQLLSDMDIGEYDESLSDADLVIISIGGNDLMKTLGKYFSASKGEGFSIREMLSGISITDIAKLISGVSSAIDGAVETYGENLSRIYEHIRHNSDAKVIIQTVYDPTDNVEELSLVSNFVNEKINALNSEIIKRSVDENGKDTYSVADVYSAFAGQGKELTNIGEMDIHPNSQGHKTIYEIVDQKVRENIYKVEILKEDITAPEQGDKKPDDTKSTILHLLGGAALIGLVVTVLIIAKRKSEQK